MNTNNYRGRLRNCLYRLSLRTRRFGAKRRCRAFGIAGRSQKKAVEQLYVINLDRQINRWHQLLKQLRYLRIGTGLPLSNITTRFSAIDGRLLQQLPVKGELNPVYSLAEQLFVDPNHLVPEDQIRDNGRVEMTRPEIAVAMSHIAVWKLIASAKHEYALIIEDDVVFSRQFARFMNAAWDEVTCADSPNPNFDVLYLSYRETKNSTRKRNTGFVFQPTPGLWQLSGYVVSKTGAEKLLRLLPVRGPVDLWINHQFDRLDVFATNSSLIQQRSDGRSDNSYSILPILSKVGAIDDETPCLFEEERLPSPVFAVGPSGTGLTSLATALSMLGYRCCSDIQKLPREFDVFSDQKKQGVFNAYVNAGPLHACNIDRITTAYKSAKFLMLVPDAEHASFCRCAAITAIGDTQPNLTPSGGTPCAFCLAQRIVRRGRSVLLMPSCVSNKWELLSRFLGCRHPANPYPRCEELGQRPLSLARANAEAPNFSKATRLKFDTTPWIMPERLGWRGFSLDDRPALAARRPLLPRSFNPESWRLLNDTFPSNMALFREGNVAITATGGRCLNVRKEFVGVRDFTAGAMMSREAYLYGQFSAVLKPARLPGLITGVFLHRNTPRQEIDIEFLGCDTTKMLINVYYNPGCDGTKFDYGYRGTPELIDLGFDAASEFHHYSIEWHPTSIRWLVDAQLVYERAHWHPTPIPHLPMQFCLNIWPCRAEELVGRLSAQDLPAYSEFESAEALSLSNHR